MSSEPLRFEPVAFDDVPAWQDDDHLAAWQAFLASCSALLGVSNDAAAQRAASAGDFSKVCRLALSLERVGGQTREGARQFFETCFKPHRISSAASEGLLTGYYEPVLKGSRKPSETFNVPIYCRPPDLVNVVSESERAKSDSFTHLRRTENGLEPHLTRAEIEEGGLAGQGLELMYFEDPVDVFFMQVQGSGRIELPGGKQVRIAYDGKNGYPYPSIGRVLIEDGQIAPEAMSLDALKRWLRADRERARAVMRKNLSYVFFRELDAAAKAPLGAAGIPLHEGRSLAVDTAFHSLGTPIYVEAPDLMHATTRGGFHRLMIAHDVGSAIKGSQRGDIYFGSGDEAGELAGVTKHRGRFFVLLPDPVALERASATAL
jgi:membrane-bound lytic murein transglycosylase A